MATLLRLLVLASEHSSPISDMDSDLEAFSHYPADGSFAALPCQTDANQLTATRKLSTAPHSLRLMISLGL
jgi:hypothetical protein